MPLIKSGSRAAENGATPEVALAYAAGLFDGEGSISASTNYHCRKSTRVLVSVGMCDRGPIDFLASTFGGRVSLPGRKTNSGKQVYIWRLYCRKAGDFLALILPYLRVKEGRARDAVALASLARGRIEAMKQPLTDVEVDQRMAIVARIRAANFSSNGRIARHAAH